MAAIKSKFNVGTTLVILFLVTLVTGIILHLKSHGIIVQPRGVLKIVHWSCGFLMVVFGCWHGVQFKKIFIALKTKCHWFWVDTWGVMVITTLAFLSGLVKLLSPVKIPHLGLWHYWFGIIMTIFIAIHLIRGVPSWNRMRRLQH